MSLWIPCQAPGIQGWPGVSVMFIRWDSMFSKSNFYLSVAAHWMIKAGLFLRTASLACWLRRPLRERKILGCNPACTGIFPGSSHTSDLKLGTPVATLPGAWGYRVSAGTGWPRVSILWLGEMERLVSYVYLSVAAHKIVWADPSLRYTCMLLGH